MVRLFRAAILMACFLYAGSAFAAGGACPSGANYLNSSGSLVTLASLGVTNCYYFSKSSGSDGNSGISESSPQAHLPGMPSYTGSITPAAGEGFILKGGDSWTASDLDLYWTWSGTSGAPIYIGVDPTWYSGGSWTRPIWTCGGASCTYTANGGGFYTDYSAVHYVTVDYIEVTGLHSSAGVYPNYFSIYGSNNTFTRIYAHGWTHATGSNVYDNSSVFSPSTCCGGGANNQFLYNVIDGSDTTQDSMAAFFGAPATVGNNIIRYVTNGIEGATNNVHDNLFGPLVFCFVSSGCHQNAIQQAAPVGNVTTTTMYNNVITGVPSGGMVKIWTMQSSVNNGALNTYVFNNVLFNNSPGNDVDICQLGSNCGTHYFFNNTFECGNDSSTDTCANPGGGGPTTVVYWTNNQCITSSVCFTNRGVNVTATLTTNVTQTSSAGTKQGYASTTAFAFQPANDSGATAGKGGNLQSLCAAIAASNPAAGAACQNDTGYACSYDTSSHTVSCPERTVNARPAEAAWDIGAYQFSSSQASAPAPAAPQPPTILKVVVQ
jgi:hypothetical protein